MSLVLPCADLLDARSATGAPRLPIEGAARIPAAELAARVHELPRRGCPVLVANTGSDGCEAVRWLSENGWPAELIDFTVCDLAPATAPRLWSPTQFLSEVIDRLSPGFALDLACGAGRDAVFLASEGWRAAAIDILPDALDRAHDLEARYLPPGSPPVRWIQMDLGKKLPPEILTADLVCCFRYLDRALLREVIARLKPGASVIVETFTLENFRRHGKPSERHSLAPGELTSIFSGLEIRQDSEGWFDDRHMARLWAVQSER